jgi:cysteine desulfuration protein SufE
MTDLTAIQGRVEAIVSDFALFDDWLGRYEYLIELGLSLTPLEEEFKHDLYRIPGCQSQVWLKPEIRDGRVYFKADSDAMITKGLVALLIRVLDGQPPDAIARAEMDFLEDIGMQEHLSSTRKNGLAAMIRRIKEYASEQIPHD